jgi:hypothetical protein
MFYRTKSGQDVAMQEYDSFYNNVATRGDVAQTLAILIAVKKHGPQAADPYKYNHYGRHGWLYQYSVGQCCMFFAIVDDPDPPNGKPDPLNGKAVMALGFCNASDQGFSSQAEARLREVVP